MSLPRLLITGAAGRIGTAFARHVGNQFDIVLADARPLAAVAAGVRTRELDIRDYESCVAACSGVDLVLHLAADASPTADFLTSLLPTNVLGTYNMFTAAANAGCKRLVFASSAQVIEGYPLDVQVSEQAPPRPGNMYGVTKAFGEALASYLATSCAMTCIAVRIANVASFSPGETHSARDVAAFISERDVVHLLERSLLADVNGFHVVNGVSDNRYKRLAVSETKRLLGYQPMDDSFEKLRFPGSASGR